ncbi:MAG: indole-3-glycerol phosphate synthase TrpC [Chitinivibrionales bacterium]|nr:indole-3-glycerol phosphate synthase TrpC [Chitinivibrionales bacterium]MBD3356060.1 indole-3-glycerol phosphate synthase TrpC [Chitinivibrionales bacterium]
MSTILDTIIEHKKREIRALREHRSDFRGRTDTKRPFIKNLAKCPAPAIIAEVKKASPSKGIIREDFDPAAIARVYDKGGADAVSVLTDERFFCGSTDYLTTIRETVPRPVLRKDFIIDPLQVEQTASLNADAMLLIAAALSDGQMEELFAAASELAIDPLIEIHNEGELERVMRLEPPLIGINNRDLATFKTDISVTLRLIAAIPRTTLVVSESGIFGQDETKPLIAAGVRAILVGESLMRSENPAALIDRLRCRKSNS